MRLPGQHHGRDNKRLEDGSDPELGLVYWLFRVKGWAPGDYARMSPGERDLVLALASYEAEHGPPQGCPFLRSRA